MNLISRLGAGRLALRNIIGLVTFISGCLIDRLKIRCILYAVLKIKMKPTKSKLKVSTGTLPGGCLVDLLKPLSRLKPINELNALDCRTSTKIGQNF